MATTFYFNDELNNNPISPSISGDWSGGAAVSNFERHLLTTVRNGDAYVNLDTTEGGSLQNVCQVQYVSEPLAAQSISTLGTIDIGVMQIVSATGATHFAFHVRIVTSSGTTRGELLDWTDQVNTIDSSVSYTQQFQNNEDIAGVTVEAGDHLVVELGYEINNTSSKDMGTKIGSSSSNLSDTDGSSTLATGFITFNDHDFIFQSGQTQPKKMMTGYGF